MLGFGSFCSEFLEKVYDDYGGNSVLIYSLAPQAQTGVQKVCHLFSIYTVAQLSLLRLAHPHLCVGEWVSD